TGQTLWSYAADAHSDGGPKQDYTFYYLLPMSFEEDCRLIDGEYICDDAQVYGFTVYDWWTREICHNWVRPTIDLDPDAPEWPVPLVKSFQPFSGRLHNPVWSGSQGVQGYGPTAQDDGPAPFAVAKFETCSPPDMITLRIVSRQNIEEIGQGIGNAYEEEDVGDWDVASIRYYANPPVVFLEGDIDPRIFMHTDVSQEGFLFRLNQYPYKDSGGESLFFTLAWDGRQWKWNLGPEVDEPYGEKNGLPYYPPGRYFLELELEVEGVTKVLDAGAVDLVYGGSLLDGIIGLPDRLRQIKQQYEDKHLQSALYSVWHKEDLGRTLSPKSLVAANLYSPVYHYDGHSDIWFFPGPEQYPPIVKDLVFIDGCDSFNGILHDYFMDNSLARVYLGWESSISNIRANFWSGYFYEGLFNLVNEQGQHYSIREAYDYASVANDLWIQVGYVWHRIPLSDPGLDYRVTEDADRNINDFEKTQY
ncbi:hypothetical protein J7J84_07685, partial [bacterium]|nr:hypothetical protein [bacterium]